MRPTILLYGATGFSGRLIAEELDDLGTGNLVLAGRDASRLRELAAELDAEYRVFSLDRRQEVRRGLQDIDVVLNAAGPFARTADRLAKVALEVNCHYVDINGEPDVYQRLDDLLLHATQRDVTMVCGAGFWAAASNLLLDEAVQALKTNEIGTVRIGMSRINTFSRGSVETVWRSLREQVKVVRRGTDSGKPRMLVWHEPVGKLEHRFDFGEGAADFRIGSAVSLVDTLAARVTLQRRKVIADGIESYVEMDPARRMCYQLGSLLTPVAAMPVFRAMLEQPMAMVAEGPADYEREEEPHFIVLEIEDRFRAPLVNWLWKTPNVYQFTAQLAAAIAVEVGKGGVAPGWITPAEVLPAGASRTFAAPGAAPASGPLRGSELHKRVG